MNIMSKLKSGASKLAEAVGAKLGDAIASLGGKRYEVSGKIGQHGQPYRRFINYIQKGPFYLQAGYGMDRRPMMIRRFIHRFLHATKGWRAFSRQGQTVKLPNIGRPRVYGPRAGAYLDHGRFVLPQPLAKNHLPGSTRKVICPYFLKKDVKGNNPGMHKMPRLSVERAPLAA